MAARELDPITVRALAALLEEFIRQAELLGVKAALVVVDWGDGTSVAAVAGRLLGIDVAIGRMARLADSAPDAVKEWADRSRAAGGVILPHPRGAGGGSN